MNTANVIEIFSSKQGEGVYVGEPMLFVRFQDCEFNCTWCDTPLSFVENRTCRIEWPPSSSKFEKIQNPVSIQTLNTYMDRFSDPVLSITGGEPLQKVPFLKGWLPTVRPKFKVLLETAGIHHNELKEVIDLIDIVSMDFKLPSSTGMKAYWEEHKQFLDIAKQKDTYVKVVVTEKTSNADVLRAIHLIKEANANIPFILQPVTPLRDVQRPSEEQLIAWKDLAWSELKDVRVTGQMHRVWKVL